MQVGLSIRRAARAFGGATLLQSGRTGAADQRNLGDSERQQGTTNVEVSGRPQRMTWSAKLVASAFTGQRPGLGKPSHGVVVGMGQVAGRVQAGRTTAAVP
jgi:hypothetical protein